MPDERVPSLADLPPRALHAYFEYVGGGSSKFYAISLEQEEGETWRVRFNFGRIGFPRAWDSRVEGATWSKAARTYLALIEEKLGKGYEGRPWPANLKLPDGSTLDETPTADDERDTALYRASKSGALPDEIGGTVAGVALPDGVHYAPEPDGGSRGEGPVIWASERPVDGLGAIWTRLAAAFPETGIWPFIIDHTYGFEGFDDYLFDGPRGRHTEVLTILRRGWSGMISEDDDEFVDEETAPFGRQFPGLAAPTPGERPTSLDHIVAGATGHLGLASVHRPADILDAVGWAGAANYDADPLDMTTVLRSWEVRFDAYVVGMGTDTLVLGVGRPAPDLDSALAVAAEHYAFCPDNIQQGAGSIREYAALIVGQAVWAFWWD